MGNIGLTSEERQELEKRGFLAKKRMDLMCIFSSIIILTEFIFIICAAGISFGSFIAPLLWIGKEVSYTNPMVNIFLSILFGIILIFLIYQLFPSIKSEFQKIINSLLVGRLFYTADGLIAFHNKYKINNPLIMKRIKNTCSNNDDIRRNVVTILTFIFIFFIALLSLFLYLNGIYSQYYLVFLIVLVVPYLLIAIVLISSSYFNPLYAFGDIGEKIQKFTPEIESQSKIIQSEFERDQNFSILHSGFEKLATTFSRIGELVLKLERVEKKANKGNLFDSEKYIGSLRTDIVTPLVELKKFLEGQREELLQSQKELTRVMVGESTELTGNRELASRRGEEVLNELDGNIGKLDIMITKIA